MIFAVVVTFAFCFTTLLGHVLHWTLHQAWSGRFYRSHLAHHVALYPADDYQSDVYRGAGKDSATLFFVGAFAPILATIVFLGRRLELPTHLVVSTVVTMVVVGALNSFVHDAFHIRGHWMSRLAIFRKWNRLHLLHHKRVRTNFGIFSFVWDRVFGTYRDVASEETK